MKVLLTGANGFVGSHVLDQLRQEGTPVAILLRANAEQSFIREHLPHIEVRTGSITDPPSLQRALSGVTHVIHCAGCTKAVGTTDFYKINQEGTRNMVEAVNAAKGQIHRLVHVSSLAAAGPATPESPARETDPPHPVSHYGKSKLGAEREVREKCQTEFVIVRPPAVYGPRDRGFLPMFSAVRKHLLPRSNPRQALSLVYVDDLAAAILCCLHHPKIAGRTFYASCAEVVSGRKMADTIARQSRCWTVPLPLPTTLLWPVCLLQDGLSRMTRKAAMLNLQKFQELRAPGWVCSPAALREATGFECATTLHPGIAATLEWYKHNRWL